MTLEIKHFPFNHTAKIHDPDTGEPRAAKIDHRIALRDIPEEVTKAQLAHYSDESLQGRLLHYEREALLERDAAARAVFKSEVTRTKAEIARRKSVAAVEAERVFKK